MLFRKEKLASVGYEIQVRENGDVEIIATSGCDDLLVAVNEDIKKYSCISGDMARMIAIKTVKDVQRTYIMDLSE